MGLAVAALFALVAPGISALLPSVTAGGVAWTGVSLAANTAFGGYLGHGAGDLALHLDDRAVPGRAGRPPGGGHRGRAAGASPSMVMAAQTGAWLAAAVAGHWFLRDLARPDTEDTVAAAAAGGAVAPVAPVAPVATTTRTGRRPRIRGTVAAKTPAAQAATTWFEPARRADEARRREAGGGRARRARARPADRRPTGYLSELLRACGGLGGILLLANLDVILAGRYLVGGDLGRYNTAALISRAAFFAPQFVALLAFPRFARPEERRPGAAHGAALHGRDRGDRRAVATAGGDGLIRVAFGAKYADPAPGQFDIGTQRLDLRAARRAAGAGQRGADGRRRAAVARGVDGACSATSSPRPATIVGFAHHTPVQIVGAATLCAAVTAAVSVVVVLVARGRPAAPRRGARGRDGRGRGGPGAAGRERTPRGAAPHPPQTCDR